MKNKLVVIFISIILIGCVPNSTPEDLYPVINGQYEDAQAVYYPSTDYKAAAIVVDKDGNVHYLRMNACGQIKDQKNLFNVSDYCN